MQKLSPFFGSYDYTRTRLNGRDQRVQDGNDVLRLFFCPRKELRSCTGYKVRQHVLGGSHAEIWHISFMQRPDFSCKPVRIVEVYRVHDSILLKQYALRCKLIALCLGGNWPCPSSVSDGGNFLSLRLPSKKMHGKLAERGD